MTWFINRDQNPDWWDVDIAVEDPHNITRTIFKLVWETQIKAEKVLIWTELSRQLDYICGLLNETAYLTDKDWNCLYNDDWAIMIDEEKIISRLEIILLWLIGRKISVKDLLSLEDLWVNNFLYFAEELYQLQEFDDAVAMCIYWAYTKMKTCSDCIFFLEFLCNPPQLNSDLWQEDDESDKDLENENNFDNILSKMMEMVDDKNWMHWLLIADIIVEKLYNIEPTIEDLRNLKAMSNLPADLIKLKADVFNRYISTLSWSVICHVLPK